MDAHFATGAAPRTLFEPLPTMHCYETPLVKDRLHHAQRTRRNLLYQQISSAIQPTNALQMLDHILALVCRRNQPDATAGRTIGSFEVIGERIAACKFATRAHKRSAGMR